MLMAKKIFKILHSKILFVETNDVCLRVSMGFTDKGIMLLKFND